MKSHPEIFVSTKETWDLLVDVVSSAARDAIIAGIVSNSKEVETSDTLSSGQHDRKVTVVPTAAIAVQAGSSEGNSFDDNIPLSLQEPNKGLIDTLLKKYNNLAAREGTNQDVKDLDLWHMAGLLGVGHTGA